MPPKKTGGVEKKSGGKKPLSGYMKYAQERRESLKKEQPNLTFGEVSAKRNAMGRRVRACDTSSHPLLLHANLIPPPTSPTGRQDAWC